MTLIDLAQALMLSFSAVFIMELGDKTQLAAFALSMRYRSPLKVFLGAILGLTGVTVLAVIIGTLMKNTVDVSLLKPIIGLLFILGGIMILIINFKKGSDEAVRICPVRMEFCAKPHENCPDIEHCDLYLKEVVQKGGFVGSLSFMFLAELGDKTMLMGVGLATQFDPWGVLFGAVLALSLINGIGVYAGDKVAKKLPRDKINLVSAILFIVLGFLIFFL
ncbi:MAG: TMEM165/GDT1 family protein [Candidatus Heimdallarchaeota archaeon]|nr:MAG: TMEM165/GDT1 family protein [Candidatus Heimdallarchaeota archaeon]